MDENGGFCQNRFSHFRICNGANFCAQEISTNKLFIRTVCLFLFLSQYINLSLSLRLFVFLYLCITRLLPRSWQWLEGATQMVSAAGRGCSTSQSRRAQMIQKQKQYCPRLQKHIFSWGEKHCPPPNYWVSGPQHRFHCKTTKDGNH